jgi:hypothetical protein
MEGARLAADAVAGWQKYSIKQRMVTTGDLLRENNKRLTVSAPFARSHLAIARIRQPQIFSTRACGAPLVVTRE